MMVVQDSKLETARSELERRIRATSEFPRILGFIIYATMRDEAAHGRANGTEPCFHK